MNPRIVSLTAPRDTGENPGQLGISTALLTPFHGDGRLNLPLYCDHANDVLAGGAHGITLFGTTGEGASIGIDERKATIQAICDSGIAADKITVGICASAVTDVAAQVRQGVEHGITQFLLLPPFYFKDLDDDGLFDWHAKVFEAAEPSAKFILYHIPQVTQVPLSVDFVMRVRAGFPDRVLAIKDSAGQWDNSYALLKTGNIPVLVGDERLLHKAAAMGGAGSICGVANLMPGRLRTLYETQAEDKALSSDVDLIVSYPVIPALKYAMVAMTGNPEWGHLRAPLLGLNAEARQAIGARFAPGKAVA